MADFYDEMAAMASDLMQPASAGGLGQSGITLTRVVPGAPDPTQPWVPVESTKLSQTLKGAARGVAKEMIGASGEGTVILATDVQVIAAIPTMGYQPGDRVSLDGRAVTVVRFDHIPAAGTKVAVRFVLRG